MVPNTALTFVLASVALWMTWRGKNSQRTSVLAVVCSLSVILIGSLIMGEYLTGTDLELEKLLFRDRLQADGTSFPGRPSPHTSLNFFFIGSAILLTSLKSVRAYRLAQVLAVLVALMALVALMGYVYQVAFLYSISSYTGMALHTALLFIILSAGVLFTHPERGLMAFVLSDTAGGMMVRHLLPATVAIPILSGGLIIFGARAGFYDLTIGMLLCVVASVVLLTALIWRNARTLHSADTKRKQAEIALQAAYDDLERRVDERTLELSRVNKDLRSEIIEHKESEIARVQLTRRLVTAQEEERRRISRELHDQTAQHLAALLLGLKTLNKSESNGRKSLQKSLFQLQELTELLVEETHHLAWELRPAALDDLGLEMAISNYVEKWSERSAITLDFHSSLDERRLAPPVETAVYRIVQEALTNVVKHAQANRVSVMLEYRFDELLVIVEDNGRGFHPEVTLTAKEGGGLGLLGIQERAALVGGRVQVESKPGSGVTVAIRIPAPASSHEKGVLHERAPHFLSR
ncbi:MAG: sensor histidine kinase [Pyrinomonadaceae bacterium]|nr:sensor histidine kinase [Pyrinomonadaceae bacterium]